MLWTIAVYFPGRDTSTMRALFPPGIRYSYRSQTFVGRDRTAVVASGGLVGEAVTDRADYDLTRHSITAGMALGLGQSKRGWGGYAPVEVGWSWGTLDARLDSNPEDPLLNSWSGVAATVGICAIRRLGKNVYISIPVLMQLSSTGKLRAGGDGLPFRGNPRVTPYPVHFGLHVGVGF
jgi:hypothetical protein